MSTPTVRGKHSRPDPTARPTDRMDSVNTEGARMINGLSAHRWNAYLRIRLFLVDMLRNFQQELLATFDSIRKR